MNIYVMMAVAFAVVLMVVSGSQLIGQASIFEMFQFPIGAVTGCEAKSGLFVVPLVGYYKCEAMAETFTTHLTEIKPVWFPSPPFYTAIPCDIYGPNCKYYKSEPTAELWWGTQVDGSNIIDPKKVSTGTNIYITTLQHGEVLYVAKQPFEYTIKRYFTPYTLYDYSPVGGRTRVYQPDEYKCSPPVEADLCMYDISGELCPRGTWKGALDFDESTNYLAGWAVAPEEYNLRQHPSYGEVYCSGPGNVYSISTVEFESGCYKIPGSFIKKEACCPGQISGNLFCNDNFQWEVLEPEDPTQVECYTDLMCPGQGVWVPEYSDIQRKTVIKYSCIDNQCVAETKVTECATSEACQTGYICMVDPTTGVGICVVSGEVPTEPREPSEPGIPDFNWMLLLRFFIIALVISFIVLGLLVYILPTFIPFFGIFRLLKPPKTFIVTGVLLALLLTVLQLPGV